MNFEAMLGNAGTKVDRWLIDWRIKGIRGSEADREKFRKEQFHGARAMMRLAVEAKVMLSPGLRRGDVLEALKADWVRLATEQADETGFNDAEKNLYIDITLSAYESLADEYLTQGL